MSRTPAIWKRTSVLAVGGGLAFWVANFAISLTPLAAHYRAALSISYPRMLLEALVGGLVIGFCVAYCLLRFYDRIPAGTSLTKSVVLSVIALGVVTILIEAPSKFLSPTSEAVGHFLIAAVFNTIRILALGVVIGVLHGRMSEGPGR